MKPHKNMTFGSVVNVKATPFDSLFPTHIVNLSFIIIIIHAQIYIDNNDY